MQPINDGTVDNMLHVKCDDNVGNAETRSAPGDLEKSSSPRQYHYPRNGTFFLSNCSNSGNLFV